jgi:hypothetical protein
MTNTAGQFRFYHQPDGGGPEMFEYLYDRLFAYKNEMRRFMAAYFNGSRATSGFKSAELKKFLKRFGGTLRAASDATKQNWVRVLAHIFILSEADVLQVIATSDVDAEADPATMDDPGPRTGKEGTARPGEEGTARPGEEGGALAVSVPTPQFTDAPASITVEAALELLADNTNSVDQIKNSRAPDRFIWTLIKYRRKSLRALWYAVFVGLGIPEADATQALNFMDPTFVDASKNTNAYSGIRTSGAHGVYPRLDDFFVRNRNTISKDFASRSSAIRAKYAAVFFSRFFGLRGKYYAKDLFALSTAELSQAAQLSRITIDVVTMDSTWSDGQPPEQIPTAAEMRGYRTGPVDFTGYL